MSSIEYIASEDSRDDNILTSTRLDTPCLDESSTKTSSNNNKIVSKNVSFHAQLIIMARSETGLSDIESLDGLISRIESSTPFSTAQSHSESIESNECQDNMSRSMFGESIISISNTQYNKEATKVRIGRSPDEMDTSRNRDIPNVANVSNLKYTSCVDEFVRQVPKLELDITTSLTNDDFSTTKHFCNGSHSRIFKAEMKVGSNPNLKSNSSSSISSIVSNTKRVVLKILSESSVENQVAQKDFQIEIDILTRLQHPHLVNIVGYGSVKSKMGEYFIRPLIALECLQGDTLSYHLGLRRSFHVQPFTKLRYFRIAKEFADVLDYIHTRVHPDFILMHRDLKPDNIGFASDGALKLFDFGLCTCVHRRTQSGKVVAKDSGSAKGSSSPGLTTDTYMLTGCTGSFRYMAPENALEKPYNESVDVYSFGIIMYEVITGVTPFKGMPREEFFARVINGGHRPGLEYDDYGRDTKMRPAVKEVLTRCWDADYSRRPTAAELFSLFSELETSKLQDYKKKGLLQKGINLLKKADSI